MKLIKLLFVFGLTAVFALSACSSKELKPLDKNSVTSRDNTLIVMGIRYEETVYDLNDETTTLITSDGLPEDAELVASKRSSKDALLLDHPLHHLALFEFYFDHEPAGDYVIERFGRHLEEYAPLGIYQVQPGTLRLESIKTRHGELLDNKAEIDFWHTVISQYNEAFGSWSLQPGNIVYLGNLTLHFYTKRFTFGLFNQEKVNRSVTLTRISIEDRFAETLKHLETEKPWFPSAKMENHAIEKEWHYADIEALKPEEPSPPQKETAPKSDNGFF